MTVTRYPKSDGAPFLTENTPAQITGDQNDYATGGYDVLRLDTDQARTITGLADGVNGRRLTIANIGSNNLVLADQDTGSATGNRIICNNSADLTLTTTNFCELYYDSTTARWRVMGVYDAKWG